MSNAKFYPAILLVVSSIILFSNLDKGSLADWDEATRAQTAKNILQDQDWFALHPKATAYENIWFHKPPLYLWILAVFYKILGVTTFASRAPSALFGIGCVYVIYMLGKELVNERTGFIASLILLTSPQFINKSRMAMLDVPVTFFISVSLLFFLLSRRNRRYLPFFAVSLALGFMTKQVVGLVPIAILSIYALLTKDFKVSRRNCAISIIIFLVLVAPWHIMQYHINGQRFIDNYFGYHVLERTMRAIEGHDYGTFYYFDVISKGFSPWIVVLPIALLYLIKGALDKKKEHIFVLGWIAAVMGTFIIVKTQLPWYIIPVYPALALAVALFLEMMVTARRRVVRTAGAILIPVLLIGAMELPPELDCNHEYASLGGNLGRNVLIHESVKKTPGLIFYIEGETVSTDELKQRLKGKGVVGMMSHIMYKEKMQDEYRILYQGGPVIFTKDRDIAEFTGVTQKNPKNCYPYMPPALYK